MRILVYSVYSVRLLVALKQTIGSVPPKESRNQSAGLAPMLGSPRYYRRL